MRPNREILNALFLVKRSVVNTDHKSKHPSCVRAIGVGKTCTLSSKHESQIKLFLSRACDRRSLNILVKRAFIR